MPGCRARLTLGATPWKKTGSSHLGWRLRSPWCSMLECWGVWPCSDPVQATPGTLSSWVHLPCHVQETLFRLAPLQPLVLNIFLPLLLKWSWALWWGRVMQILHLWVSIPQTMTLFLLCSIKDLQRPCYYRTTSQLQTELFDLQMGHNSSCLNLLQFLLQGLQVQTTSFLY